MSGFFEFLRCRVLRNDLQAGRVEAVEDLFNLLAAPLYHHALFITKNSAEAEEVLQEVFLELVRHPERLSQVKDLKPYLFRAVRNRALNRGRSREVPTEPQLLLPAPRTTGTTADALVLEQALDRLAEEQREVVLMKIYQGLTFQEIAAVVGVSPNTAASRYRYALEHLKKLLGDA